MISCRVAKPHEGTSCYGCPAVSDAGVASLMGGRVVRPLFRVEIDGGGNLVHEIRLCKECLSELRTAIREP